MKISFTDLKNDIGYSITALYELQYRNEITDSDMKRMIANIKEIQGVYDRIIEKYGSIVSTHENFRTVSTKEFYSFE